MPCGATAPTRCSSPAPALSRRCAATPASCFRPASSPGSPRRCCRRAVSAFSCRRRSRSASCRRNGSGPGSRSPPRRFCRALPPRKPKRRRRGLRRTARTSSDGLHELHAGDSRGAPPRRCGAGAARRLGDRPGAPGTLGMTRTWELSLDDIEALAVGARILGTGGGGSPYLGLLNMRRLYAEGHRVALMPPDALADDDWVAAVSNMGAPLVGQERLTDSRTIARAVTLMEEHRGAAFRAVMALEIGGGNSIQPLMAA